MKKIISVLLMLCLIAAMTAIMPLGTSAVDTIGIPTSIYDGTVATTWVYDSQITEYHITNASELAAFAAAVDDGATFAGCTVYLDCDIVWNDGVASETGFVLNDPEGTLNEWNPIGATTATTETSTGNYFCGNFNGQGHTISGLYYNADYGTGGMGRMTGLFSVFRGNHLENLNITNSYLRSGQWTGSFAGSVWPANASVEGGIVLENLYSDAYIEVNVGGASTTRSGGIAGMIKCTLANTVKLKKCWFNGDVIGTSGSAGGIGGITGYSNGNASSSSNVGNYSIVYEDCLFSGKIAGVNPVGGITGQIYKTSVTMTRCIALLDAASIANTANAGGLAGQVKNSNYNIFTVTNCWYKPVTGKIDCAFWSDLSGSISGGSVRTIEGSDYSTKTMTELASDTVCQFSAVSNITQTDFDADIWTFTQDSISIVRPTATPVTNTLGLTMEKGAMIRLNEHTGIRFISTVNKSAMDDLVASGATIEIGTLIAPTEYVTQAGGFTREKLDAYATAESIATAYIDVEATVGTWFAISADTYTFAGSIVNVKTTHYETEFSARAYVKVTDANGVSNTYYTDYSVENNSRSISSVASGAYQDRADTKSGDYKYDVNSEYLISGAGSFSPYTNEQLGILYDFFH